MILWGVSEPYLIEAVNMHLYCDHGLPNWENCGHCLYLEWLDKGDYNADLCYAVVDSNTCE